MARHFRRQTLLGANDREVVDGWFEEGPVPLELGSYCGFMIGPDSDHDIVRLVVGTDTFTLPAGAVVPCDPVAGVPTVELLRTFGATNAFGGAAKAVLHLIGLTCAEELAVTPRRAPIRREYVQTGTPGIVKIPLGGRRHALVHIATGAAGTLVLEGWDPLGGQATLLASTAIASGSTAYNVGGTDHEELWPTLRVNCSVSCTITVHACGENGG